MHDPTRKPYAIGVDTGGTHTDLVLAGNGKLATLKVPSTPEDLNVGILEGVDRLLAETGVAVEEVGRFAYASTYVTNLFVEGKEGGIGLLTTAGFRDVLEIGRASRKPDVYDIHWRPARPLVPRNLRHDVVERIDHRGDILTPLDEGSARRALRALADAGVRSVAVCFLHAYANPVHERRVGEIARAEFPSLDVSLSCDVVREFREFERTSTTCVNAFIRGPIRRHLAGLGEKLAQRGIDAPSYIMQGNGGVSTFASAAESPTAVVHSGVMGGMVGATALGQECGVRNLITLDMGGTSADVSLIADGTPLLTNRSRIGPHPLLVPTLDMVTIGAGGGSIAWVEGGFGLRVGPHSAGSVPGPACYGQGGTQPTVTDANLVLGRLNASYFLGGARTLDLARATAAIRTRVAEPLGMTIEAAAFGIIAIAEAHMADAIRLVSVERGLDPRDFTLVAFGGAGPLHAVRLAEALSIGSVLVPPAPGNLSAMGLLCADVRHDLARTLLHRLSQDFLPQVRAVFDEILAEADAALASDGVPAPERRCTLSADLRYQGQNYELTIPVTERDLRQGFADLVARFNDQHRRIYGYQLAGREVQLVNARVTAVGRTQHAHWPVNAAREAAAPVAARSLLVEPRMRVDAPVYRFDDLAAEQAIAGAAIVEYRGSTLFLPSGWHARLDARGNARLVREPVAPGSSQQAARKEMA
jgi:N-methylhydantoinase A